MKNGNRQSKMANIKGLVIAIVVLLAIVTSFFTAMTVYEQLNIHWFVDIAIAGIAGIATALFQAALIGFSRFIRGVPAVKTIMFAAAIFLTSLTIMGVYSAMQSSFFRNVIDSGNYQRLSKQSDALQKKFDRQIELNHITKSQETAWQLEETNNQLSNAEKSGSGAAQNQWATNLSGVLGVDPGAVSFGRHTIIGLAIDLCYYLALWFLFYGLLFREKTPVTAVLPLDEEYENYDEDYPKWKKRNGNNGNNNSGDDYKQSSSPAPAVPQANGNQNGHQVNGLTPEQIEQIVVTILEKQNKKNERSPERPIEHKVEQPRIVHLNVQPKPKGNLKKANSKRKMDINERRIFLKTFVHNKPEATVAEMCSATNVKSRTTIQTDLDYLGLGTREQRLSLAQTPLPAYN